jgi:hypothetical protein
MSLLKVKLDNYMQPKNLTVMEKSLPKRFMEPLESIFMMKGTFSLLLSLILVGSLLFSLSKSIAYFANDRPTIYVEPPEILDTSLTPGKNFTIQVRLHNGTGLYGVEIKIAWNNTSLSYLSHTVLLGQVDGVLNPPILTAKNGVYYDSQGSSFYWLAATSMPPASSWSGNGTIVEITFQVEDTGWCYIDVYGTVLVDYYAQEISHDVRDGYFCNIEFQGDVDGDGKVGLSDLVLLAKSYGSRPTDPNWDPRCDFDHDLTVGLSDLVILAKNYGRTRI